MLRCILCALWKGMSLVDTFFVLAGMVLSTNVEMLLVSFAGMGCVLSLHVVMHSVLAALGRLGQHMLRFILCGRWQLMGLTTHVEMHILFPWHGMGLVKNCPRKHWTGFAITC